ncbi:TIGR03617 family F420-dependent LLM class oxidoreductase [Streptomyces triticirhizae]|uniref:TIGR03617 family F420-dependent LLM class oxidoreductase n=1 Tax=Streptomyces triticirhizae TaxID=2483353 RepID=UPI0018F53ECE|nr:TIGR03617 family F420-dependent LLM class oxidoreductase [Streptomyces triticirhizae]
MATDIETTPGAPAHAAARPFRAGFAAISVAPGELGQLAGALEENGYQELVVSETRHDPFVSLTVAAGGSRSVALRSGIAVAFARNPMSTAMLANDLQTLSGGRFTLGLGTQLKAHITKRFGMPWSAPVARMREYVQALRAIWHSFETGERLRFRGEFYRHTLMVPFFDPGPNPHGWPPVVLGGVGEAMTEMAGEVADGFVAHNITTPRFLTEVTLPALRRGRERAGRDMADFELHLTPMVATGRTEEEYQRAVASTRSQLAFYVAAPTYASILELHGLGEVRDELHRLASEGRADEMPSVIDDSVLRTFAFVGEAEDVARQLHDTYAGHATSLSFYEPNVTDPHRWLPLIRRLREIDTAERAG